MHTCHDTRRLEILQWFPNVCEAKSKSLSVTRDTFTNRHLPSFPGSFLISPYLPRWIRGRYNLSCVSDFTQAVNLCWATNFSMNCFLGGSVGKESACNVGDLCLILGLGRPPGVGNGNPLQYPCLENSMDRGAWWATVLGVAKSWTRLSNLAQHTSHPLRVQACFPQNTFPWPFFSCSGLSRIHTSFFSYYVQIVYPHMGVSLKYINVLIPTKL